MILLIFLKNIKLLKIYGLYGNGLLSSKTEKGQKGDKGQGFRLTADKHFHLENKRLTNLAPPLDNNDAVTKKHLNDALKSKLEPIMLIWN